MKSIVFALASLVATAIAQTPYNVQSRPFRLVLHSGNATIDGTVVGACHAGAAVEALCLTTQKLTDPSSYATIFTHNVTATPDAIDSSGVLVFLLVGSNFVQSEPMKIAQLLTSNIAVPIFSPSDEYSLVSFDEDGALYMSSTQDDTVSPPQYRSNSLNVENWYTCLTHYTYTYYTLSWKVGLTGEPQNPSCEKVEVQRVFVGEEAQAIAKMNLKKGQY